MGRGGRIKKRKKERRKKKTKKEVDVKEKKMF
jgi:hypothetical protein